KPHASPSVRKFARELGVDLARVTGTAAKQRITHDDVRPWVKAAVVRADEPGRAASAAGGDTGPPPGLAPWPQGDFGEQRAAASAAGGDAGSSLGLAPWPKVDFEKYGAVERQSLSRIRKHAAANLHRNWVMIPHVTNQEDADVTELETFRVRLNEEQGKGGVK